MEWLGSNLAHIRFSQNEDDDHPGHFRGDSIDALRFSTRPILPGGRGDPWARWVVRLVERVLSRNEQCVVSSRVWRGRGRRAGTRSGIVRSAIRPLEFKGTITKEEGL